MTDNTQELFNQQKQEIFYLLKEMLSCSKDNKNILDTYYEKLNKYISIIQTSVIFFSTVSAFLQGLRSEITIPNTISFIITLVISTYISLVLSLSKFFKLDELKEQINNLTEKYAEFHNNIQLTLDDLKQWNNVSLLDQEKMSEWTTFVKEFYINYSNTIKTKKLLFVEYEKILNSSKRNYYQRLIRKHNIKNEIKIKKLRETEIKLDLGLGIGLDNDVIQTHQTNQGQIEQKQTNDTQL
jgi:hypothetical protein